MLLNTVFECINCNIECITLFLMSHCKKNGIFAFNFTAIDSVAIS